MRRVAAGALTAGLAMAPLAAGATVASASPASAGVAITVAADGSVRAPASVSPGLTCLQVGGAPGETVQLARPRHGGTRSTLAADVAAYTSSGLPVALEHDFELAGGTDVGSTMCTLLRPGTYYALDTTPETVTPQQIAPVTVTGAPHAAPLPRLTGAITAVGAMSWAPAPSRMAARGTLGFVNASTETHFVSLVRYQPGKGLADLRAVLADPDGYPGTVLDQSAHLDSGVVSAGGAQTLTYALPPGRYAVLCFWPDLETGVPHAMMGMVRSITVG